MKRIFKSQIFSKILSLLILTSLVCLVQYNAVALELTNTGLFIKSSKLTINRLKQIAIFGGNVSVSLEAMHLNAEHLDVHYNEINNQQIITKIVIPCHLTAMNESTGEMITANRGEYDIQQNKLILTGEVKLLKGNNLLVTDEMIYFSPPSFKLKIK